MELTRLHRFHESVIGSLKKGSKKVIGRLIKIKESRRADIRYAYKAHSKEYVNRFLNGITF